MKVPIQLKYFFFVYILAISTFEFFFRISQPATYLLFPLSAASFYYFKKRFDYSVLVIILPFFLAFSLQHVLYDTPIYFAFSLIIRILAVYLSVKIIGIEFIRIFINTIKVISYFSIFFYLIQYVPAIHNIMISISEHFTNLGSQPETVIDRPNFIIYAIQQMEEGGPKLYRNSGPFWEPGLFVVFLNIAFFFNTFYHKELFSKTNTIFLINILSTLSTTGFIVLLMIFITYIIIFKSLNIQYKILLILILISCIPAIFSLSFMSKKINDQIGQSDLSYSRFGAAVVHWKIIQDYPYAGLPNDNNKTYSKYSDNISPNGITEIFVRYGVIAGFIYYFILFLSCGTIMYMLGNPHYGIYLFIILVTLIMSQTIGTSPIYWSFVLNLTILGDKEKNLLRLKRLIEIERLKANFNIPRN